jgi:hypothetical protein
MTMADVIPIRKPETCATPGCTNPSQWLAVVVINGLRQQRHLCAECGDPDTGVPGLYKLQPLPERAQGIVQDRRRGAREQKEKLFAPEHKLPGMLDWEHEHPRQPRRRR